MSRWYRTTGRGAAVAVFLLLCGCRLVNGPERPLPLPDGVIPEQVIDADNPSESVTPLDPDDLADVGKLIQAERQKRLEEAKKKDPNYQPPKKYNVLALSGGGVYGAFSAGVLCGWTQSGLPPEKGGRPTFDVVTGISTGSLIAPFAFLGPKYDDLLRREYTTTRTEDIYKRQRRLTQVLNESFNDNTPLRERVDRSLDFCVMKELADAHDQGRRLYLGTTNIDTKRIVLWDVGAIAKRGTADARRLIVDVVMASSAIPAFFPPVRIDVTIDGRPYQELHVDGSVTRSLFFRPPIFPDTRKADPDRLTGSNLYVIVAGKINPAPAAVRLRTLPLALESSTLLLYSLTRGDLYRMYTYCLLTGMNYRVAASPDDQEVPTSATEFVPEEMTKLFEYGYGVGRVGDVTRTVVRETPDGKAVESVEEREGTAWRDVPPGLKGGEKQGARTGRNLTIRPKEDGQGSPRGPEPPRRPGPTAPPIPGGG
jgi:predicted acylesterase/phospholipase RssA